jgi:hypothetical protein
VHWTYDEEAWASANEIEATRLRRTAYVGALFGLVGALVIVVVSLPLGEAGAALRFSGALVAGGSLVAIATIGGTSASLLARRHRRGEIYISELGILRRPGGYTPLRGFGYWLQNVELRGSARQYIHFDITVTNRPGTDSLADVQVPPGREAEARDLVARLRREVLFQEPEPTTRPATPTTLWIDEQ